MMRRDFWFLAVAAACLAVVTAAHSENITMPTAGGGSSVSAATPRAVISASFARPATTPTYVVGQMLANSATAGSVTPLSFSVASSNAGLASLFAIRMSKTGTTNTSASFRLHLFSSCSGLATTVGDTGTYSGAVNSAASDEIGYFDITMDQVGTDGSRGYLATPERVLNAGAAVATICGYIEARAGYVGQTGETFKVELEVKQ